MCHLLRSPLYSVELTKRASCLPMSISLSTVIRNCSPVCASYSYCWGSCWPCKALPALSVTFYCIILCLSQITSLSIFCAVPADPLGPAEGDIRAHALKSETQWGHKAVYFTLVMLWPSPPRWSDYRLTGSTFAFWLSPLASLSSLRKANTVFPLEITSWLPFRR